MTRTIGDFECFAMGEGVGGSDTTGPSEDLSVKQLPASHCPWLVESEGDVRTVILEVLPEGLDFEMQELLLVSTVDPLLSLSALQRRRVGHVPFCVASGLSGEVARVSAVVQSLHPSIKRTLPLVLETIAS